MMKFFNVLVLGWERGDKGRKYKKPKRGDVEQDARKASAEDRARSIKSQDTAQGTLSQFEGPVQDSPFYKALKTAGTEGTANAYQSAKSNVRARANAAGFGGPSPVGQGAEAGVESEEAKAQARVPGEALTAATGPALSAASTTAGIGATQGGQGLGYMTGAAVPLEQQYQQQLAARRAAMWKAIQTAGAVGAAPFTGGASLAALPATTST